MVREGRKEDKSSEIRDKGVDNVDKLVYKWFFAKNKVSEVWRENRSCP